MIRFAGASPIHREAVIRCDVAHYGAFVSSVEPGTPGRPDAQPSVEKQVAAPGNVELRGISAAGPPPIAFGAALRRTGVA